MNEQQRKRNLLEASAERLGMRASFARKGETESYPAGWYLVGLDGRQRDTWLGPTIRQALVAFEAKFNRAAYL